MTYLGPKDLISVTELLSFYPGMAAVVIISVAIMAVVVSSRPPEPEEVRELIAKAAKTSST